jgi:Homeodomain-like domain-containing protein
VAKRKLRAEALRLREAGWSLRQIARHLDVALSSVSVWTRGVVNARPAEPPSPGPRRPRHEPLRWCSRCSRLRGESSFNRHGSGLQWWCRDCFKRYYEEQRARHRRRNNALKTARVREAQIFVLEYLRDHPCMDCGEADPVILEFDHLGAKRAEISTLVRRGVLPPVLETEIGRCEVVCASCHRRRTARRGSWRRAAVELSAVRWRSKTQERNVRFALAALAASGCVDCAEADVCVLDFDHVGPKTGTVMELARREVGLQRLRDEIARCVVRCANCHRRRTATSAGHYRARAGVPPARVELALPD